MPYRKFKGASCPACGRALEGDGPHSVCPYCGAWLLTVEYCFHCGACALDRPWSGTCAVCKGSLLAFPSGAGPAPDVAPKPPEPRESPDEAAPSLEKQFIDSTLERLEAKDPKGVLEYSSLALALVPGFPLLLFARGWARRRLGQIPEAIQDFSDCILGAPDDPLAWEERGFARWETGRDDEAVCDFLDAMQRRHDLENPLLERCRTRMLQKELSGARDDLQRYLRLRAEDADAVALLGLAFVLSGDHRNGLRLSEDALRMNPDQAEALLGVGMILDAYSQQAGARGRELAGKAGRKILHAQSRTARRHWDFRNIAEDILSRIHNSWGTVWADGGL